MKTFRAFKVILLINIFCSFSLFSQDTIPVKVDSLVTLTKKDSVITSYWLAGVGANIVDDAGDLFKNSFDIENRWNIAPYPSRISVGKYFKSGLGVELIISHNTYKGTKVVDGIDLEGNEPYWAADIRGSYNLNKLVGDMGWFDPYIHAGLGYADAATQTRGTMNAGFGFRTWFSEKWGLDLNTTGKWTMNLENSTNHIQHAAGVVYRFGIKKELTKEGEEKLAYIKQQEKIQDSIIKAEELKELERVKLLEQEMEKQRLADVEEQKAEEKITKQKELEDLLKDLSDIHFAFDSSTLNADAKNTLNQLAEILKQNPTLTIEVGAHTDARGAAAYNMKLSERRANSTVKYLIDNGIDASRLVAKAYGETQLKNSCADGVKCSEAMHKENRRSEFKILSF